MIQSASNTRLTFIMEMECVSIMEIVCRIEPFALCFSTRLGYAATEEPAPKFWEMLASPFFISYRLCSIIECLEKGRVQKKSILLEIIGSWETT